MPQHAIITKVSCAFLKTPTTVVSGWDDVPARDTKYFSKRGKKFIVVFPEEWKNEENDALLIDPVSGAVSAISSKQISIQ